MDESLLWLLCGIGAAVVVIVAVIAGCYKVARAEQALVITGGKSPKITVAGGGIVIPIIRRHQFFDLCVRTISSDKDEIKTKVLVPIVVMWTAQVRPAKEPELLECAVRSFAERNDADIVRDLKLTLDGAVREVVAKMTPEQVSSDKEQFTKLIQESVTPELRGFGMELVSLNIQDVTDDHNYFENLAAKDSEVKRQEAAQVKASADQAIRERQAEAEQIAKNAELDSQQAIAERTASTERVSQEAKLASDLAIAEKMRDTEVAKSKYLAEQETAAADAEIAKDLQTAERNRDLAVKNGAIKVAEQEQANLAAQKAQQVTVTEAETARKKTVIEAEAGKTQTIINAEASSEKQQIDAKAAAEVAQTQAEGQANAARRKAAGEADAKMRVAEAEANSTKVTADAEAIKIEKTGTANAEVVQKTGQAEAEAIKAKGLAEAEAIKAKGLAEAEAEQAMADARAAHEGVNMKVTLAEIRANAEISIATNIGTIMAKLGENAQFIDMGGSGTAPNSGDLLTRVLGGVPELLKALNIKGNALNGTDGVSDITTLLNAVTEPFKGEATEEKA